MESDESQQPAVGEPAGQQLKKAREKLGLTLENVAETQHLRASIIQAIEACDYEQINSELFLKGYVRGYAKQVGVDADQLIANLDHELEPLREKRERQAEDHPLVDIERKRLKKRRIAKTLLILALVAGLGLIAWNVVIGPRLERAQESDPTADTSYGDSVDDVTADAGTESMEDDRSPETENAGNDDVLSAELGSSVSETEESSEYQAESDSYENPVEDDAPGISNAELTNSPGSLSVSEPDPAVTVDESDLDSEFSRETVTEPVTNPPQSLTTAEPPATETSQEFEPQTESSFGADSAAAGRLTMVFGADCWVQVTDASGRKLVASLQRAGDRVDVVGDAPLNVVIGAVDAVDVVTFAGEAVELSEYRVINNRTEFTLTL